MQRARSCPRVRCIHDCLHGCGHGRWRRLARNGPALCHDPRVTIGLVLGGGGVRGAVQVGMLRALFEAGIVPDTIVGTSIGAIHGAAVANDPTIAVVDRLVEAWASPAAAAIYGDSWPK